MDKQRYWFIDKGRLGIVELSQDAVTQELATSSYISPSEIKGYRIDYIALPSALSTDLTATDDVLSEIPAQFHEYVVARVIAQGYMLPANANVAMAQMFQKEYADGIREGKIYARQRFRKNVRVIPQEY